MTLIIFKRLAFFGQKKSMLYKHGYPMVRPEGFEPSTLGAEIRYSIQLNYGRVT